MKKINLTLAATAVVLGLVTVSDAQQPYINEVALFPGTGLGTTYDYQQPISVIAAPGVTSTLNASSGLGAITYTSTAMGAQYFGLFLDIDNDLKNSTAFEDEGTASGTPFIGETWEIGDAQRTTAPDIFDDAASDTLANANTINTPGYAPPVNSPNGDISFALGFDFNPTVPGTETITIISSLTKPASGFYLEQDNIQDVQNGVSQPNYLYASASFTPAGQQGAPDGGSTMTALTMGVMALAGLKYRLARK